jgi:hypothetical protein
MMLLALLLLSLSLAKTNSTALLAASAASRCISSRVFAGDVDGGGCCTEVSDEK